MPQWKVDCVPQMHIVADLSRENDNVQWIHTRVLLYDMEPSLETKSVKGCVEYALVLWDSTNYYDGFINLQLQSNKSSRIKKKGTMLSHKIINGDYKSIT